jgi:hypothetical protein
LAFEFKRPNAGFDEAAEAVIADRDAALGIFASGKEGIPSRTSIQGPPEDTG